MDSLTAQAEILLRAALPYKVVCPDCRGAFDGFAGWTAHRRARVC